MEDAVEALVNVMTDFHKSNNQPLTEEDEIYLAGFYDQFRRAIFTQAARLAKFKPGLSERALHLLLERARRSRPEAPRGATTDGSSPIEMVEVTLVRLLVQPCILEALSTRGGLATVVCDAAKALQADSRIPRDKFSDLRRQLSEQKANLPLEIHQLALLVLRDAVLDTQLPIEDREAGLTLLMTLTKNLGHILPPELHLRFLPSEKIAGNAPRRFRSTIGTLRRPPTRVLRHREPQRASTDIDKGPTRFGESAVSIETPLTQTQALQSSSEIATEAACTVHNLQDSWGVYCAHWDCEGYTRIEDEHESEVTFSTIEGFWECCEEGDAFKPLPFTKKNAHKQYLGRKNPKGEKVIGIGRLSWKCSLEEGSKQWIEIVLALIGEGWTEDFSKIAGNRILGVEWCVTRDCTFTLWFSQTAVPQDAVVRVLSKHLDVSYIDLSTARAYA
eukprot:m.133336 g.133336  ORF g.133336 m.133336 type:complete len:446 (-) comp13833_c1_seq2:1640-2977(-)